MRLFIGIDPGNPFRQALAKTLEPLVHAVPARWIPSENLHLTLQFLGSVDPTRVPEVEAALPRLSESFTLTSQKITAVPSPQRCQMLWLSLEPDPALTKLKDVIALSLAPLGFQADDRPFQPHITLARFKKPVQIRTPLPDPKLLTFPVESFELYESLTLPEGARYRLIRSFS